MAYNTEAEIICTYDHSESTMFRRLSKLLKSNQHSRNSTSARFSSNLHHSRKFVAHIWKHIFSSDPFSD